MATGAGKTYTAITAVYRLLKFAGAKRVLFLVDTRNFRQAGAEFMAYTPPDDGRTFTELYNVQRLASSSLDPHAQVCISTIQRMYSILSGEHIDEASEDLSLNEWQPTSAEPRWVRYNPAVPVESFDFIIIDECHRSIYNVEGCRLFRRFPRRPDHRLPAHLRLFHETWRLNIERGLGGRFVNVGYDVRDRHRSHLGAELEGPAVGDHRDRATRKRRCRD